MWFHEIVLVSTATALWAVSSLDVIAEIVLIADRPDFNFEYPRNAVIIRCTLRTSYLTNYGFISAICCREYWRESASLCLRTLFGPFSLCSEVTPRQNASIISFNCGVTLFVLMVLLCRSKHVADLFVFISPWTDLPPRMYSKMNWKQTSMMSKPIIFGQNPGETCLTMRWKISTLWLLAFFRTLYLKPYRNAVQLQVLQKLWSFENWANFEQIYCLTSLFSLI